MGEGIAGFDDGWAREAEWFRDRVRERGEVASCEFAMGNRERVMSVEGQCDGMMWPGQWDEFSSAKNSVGQRRGFGRG